MCVPVCVCCRDVLGEEGTESKRYPQNNQGEISVGPDNQERNSSSLREFLK